MNDVLVEVFSQATLKGYEFWIPKTALIRDVKRKLAEEIMIYENNNDLFDTSKIDKMILTSKRTGQVFNSEYTVLESGILSGDVLIFV